MLLDLMWIVIALNSTILFVNISSRYGSNRWKLVSIGLNLILYKYRPKSQRIIREAKVCERTSSCEQVRNRMTHIVLYILLENGKVFARFLVSSMYRYLSIVYWRSGFGFIHHIANGRMIMAIEKRVKEAIQWPNRIPIFIKQFNYLHV